MEVQRGTVTINDPNRETTFNITAVPVGQSFAMATGRSNTDGYTVGMFSAYAELTTIVGGNYTQLKIRRGRDGTSAFGDGNGESTFAWEVVTDPDMSVQMGQIDLVNITTNIAIVAVTLNRSFVIISSTGHGMEARGFPRGRLTAVDNLELYIVDNGIGRAEVCWYVVEWVGVTVQRGLKTLVSGTATQTQAITAVDLTQSCLIWSYASQSTSLRQADDMVRARLSAADTIQFYMGRGDWIKYVAWEVVSAPFFFAQRGLRTIAAASSAGTVTLPTPINIARAFVTPVAVPWGNAAGDSTSTNTHHRSATTHVLHQVGADSRVTLTRGSTANICYGAYEVVEWSPPTGGSPGNIIHKALAAGII